MEKKTFAEAMQLSYSMKEKDELYITPNIEHLLELENNIDSIIDEKLSEAMENISMSQLSMDDLDEIMPRSMSLSVQDSMKIPIEYNGDMRYVKASGLDYSRIRIASSDLDESSAREGDFIFRRM